ncbi:MULTISPECIES: FAD-binding oxidoreductase [Bacillales]|jgi:glycolate oxidase FAD binding subunit|uniref:FAD-binding oxidoreductase n=1 Tax=Brevibacillus TaxID=55080 RepID=UPI000E37FDDD|nr:MULTISPECIES: FAD-binding oxidoreductase [Bacillales]NNV01745.1 FAD-binding oxidoreductase [Brevibacillus sp. MCWH]REK68086.1 MAG: FAD-binding oxidoreductase [Brevibacillus sp.]UFJ60881.1 FAD-binding oxidoreductase [Anoxybacillus sediminis]
MDATLISQVIGTGSIRPAANSSHVLGNHGLYEVFPETEEEIAAVLRAAYEQGWTVIPMGGGTKRGFGGTEANTDILLGLSAFRGIVDYAPGDMTVTVKPGTTIQEINTHLAAHGQMLPFDPYWPRHATVGGVVAANDSGPKRMRYGSVRDHVIGMRVVYPNGRIIRTGGKVVKNVAGYDMNKLFIGSMGTLGVMSEITLKLRPLPPFQTLLLLAFSRSDFTQIRSFAVSLLDSLMEPVSMEFLSPAVNQYMSGGNGYALAIAFEDEEKAVRYQEEWVKARLPKDTEILSWEQEEAAEWWMRFARLPPSALSSGDGEETMAIKIGSKNLDVLEIVKTCHELGERYDLAVQTHGGVGHGITRVYLRGNPAHFAAYLTEIRSLAESRGGYAVIQHATLKQRRELDVWGRQPAAFFLMEGIKRTIDPRRVLNPNRFIGGI